MDPYEPPRAILIAGPTASGKSAYAIKQALASNGVIINADSMQVYRHLQIVTARPDSEQLKSCTHVLYGHRDPGQDYSVASWLEEARQQLSRIVLQGKTPVFVGGTGLYFKGLVEGLSAVPKLDPTIRAKWREFGLKSGNQLHGELKLRDIDAAKNLRPSDHQRLIRALEVIDSTGVSLLEWQKKPMSKPLVHGENIKKIVLMPERATLHERINLRFDEMVDQGALAEVQAFIKLGVDTSMPAMKAIGVPQFARYLQGEISQDQAIEMAKAASRQYAKRQSTWFNNQFDNEWEYVR